eukprot:477233_1
MFTQKMRRLKLFFQIQFFSMSSRQFIVLCTVIIVSIFTILSWYIGHINKYTDPSQLIQALKKYEIKDYLSNADNNIGFLFYNMDSKSLQYYSKSIQWISKLGMITKCNKYDDIYSTMTNQKIQKLSNFNNISNGDIIYLTKWQIYNFIYYILPNIYTITIKAIRKRQFTPSWICILWGLSL